jgi:vacuolar protein sorting-associated protein 54
MVRQTLLSHSKAFVDQLHESNKTSISLVLDNERWSQCDVDSERQAAVERLVGGRMFSANSGISNSSSINNVSHSTGGLSNDDKGGLSSGKNGKECRALIVDGGTQFNIVHSVLYLIEICISYIDISFAFPPLTGEIISKCIDLFRLFDSRTRQLVLGAQAIQSTRLGLKSISAKHLALASQSVGLAKALLPHIRTAFLAQLPPKQHLMLVEFDRLSHELSEHHGQIVSKFVSIVSDMSDSLLIKLKAINWDKLHGPCEYFEEIIKNVSILHRVLIAILPTEQLQHVFSRIFLLLNRKIVNHFEDIMPQTTTGKQRIIDEIVHLSASFSQLKSLQGPTLNPLEESFRKKYGGVANI